MCLKWFKWAVNIVQKKKVYVWCAVQLYVRVSVTEQVQLYVRDSRTIDATEKHLLNRQRNAALQYYQITYCCIHGGRHYKSHGSGGGKLSKPLPKAAEI